MKLKKKIILGILAISCIFIALGMINTVSKESIHEFSSNTSSNIIVPLASTKKRKHKKTLMESMIENNEPEFIIENTKEMMEKSGKSIDNWIVDEDDELILGFFDEEFHKIDYK